MSHFLARFLFCCLMTVCVAVTAHAQAAPSAAPSDAAPADAVVQADSKDGKLSLVPGDAWKAAASRRSRV